MQVIVSLWSKLSIVWCIENMATNLSIHINFVEPIQGRQNSAIGQAIGPAHSALYLSPMHVCGLHVEWHACDMHVTCSVVPCRSKGWLWTCCWYWRSWEVSQTQTHENYSHTEEDTSVHIWSYWALCQLPWHWWRDVLLAGLKITLN